MMLTTVDVETDVRRQYNRRVLFCIRIRAAALLIGLWDLMVHSIVLCALIFMFRHSVPKIEDEPFLEGHPSLNSQQSTLVDSHPDQLSRSMMEQKSILSSNFLLNRILEKRNVTRMPMGLNTRHFYSNLDLMTVKWASSLSSQDKCIVFFVVFSATILILAHICGVLTNKPSYIVPYFLIKVFNVIISILSMLGFYAYMPDVAVWLRVQPDFPFKYNLLELDSQTLQLVIFSFLLFIVLAKIYIAAIIWYCYGYITALTMARSIGTFTTNDDLRPITGEMYSPPKYEEAIKSTSQQQFVHAPPPYTPMLHSSM
ncbi:unnamed protein product [Adineta ricciae]|uniref:Lysosomal-associated transmembrane protein 4A n=1 Tax=Adineta ricciae TaxID=249248 RepID=A0A815Y376_ADIRI|nr:unnamed protein product [Adineta ricciae]